MATMTEQVSKLLDFSQKLDITLLENIVGCMYTGTGDQVSYIFCSKLYIYKYFLFFLYN